MERYKIKSGDIDQISKSFAANVDILKGVGETIGSPDEIEVHLDPAIEDFKEMHEIARWFKDMHKKAADKLNQKFEKKELIGKSIYILETELNERIDKFLTDADGQESSMESLVKLFNPVQIALNNLLEQSEYLEALVGELRDEVDELQAIQDKTVFDQSLNLGGSSIQVLASGNLSITNQDTLEKMLDAIQKDEIVCNQNVNAFF